MYLALISGAVVTGLLLATEIKAASVNDLPFRGEATNVVGQFKKLPKAGHYQGFRMDEAGGNAIPSLTRHFQGIVRVDRGDDAYFLVTASGNDPTGIDPQGDHPGQLLVVKVGSHRSNGEALGATRGKLEAADAKDRVVGRVLFNGKDGIPDYGHPGSMQAMGQWLFIPLEAPRRKGEPQTALAVFDVGNPEAPRISSVHPLLHKKAGCVAVTPLSGDEALVVVTGELGQEKKAALYRARLSDSGVGPMTHWRDWHGEVSGTPRKWDNPWKNEGNTTYQMVNFVRETTGKLYLIGTYNQSPVPMPSPDNKDLMDLYEVEANPTTGKFDLKFVRSHHQVMRSAPTGLKDMLDVTKRGMLGDNRASAGVFVTPGRKLIVYSCEHQDGGPSRTVRTGEWQAK